ncbi:DUF4181 domain-containing protein [Alkalihalophilus lindianensis]|uniref:DUF4181 domain-containing protein n=1 Tax=Alkalihalophilus lindianensis TaxID=1630542 RepID=UPI0034DE6A62
MLAKQVDRGARRLLRVGDTDSFKLSKKSHKWIDSILYLAFIFSMVIAMDLYRESLIWFILIPFSLRIAFLTYTEYRYSAEPKAYKLRMIMGVYGLIVILLGVQIAF